MRRRIVLDLAYQLVDLVHYFQLHLLSLQLLQRWPSWLVQRLLLEQRLVLADNLLVKAFLFRGLFFELFFRLS